MDKTLEGELLGGALPNSTEMTEQLKKKLESFCLEIRAEYGVSSIQIFTVFRTKEDTKMVQNQKGSWYECFGVLCAEMERMKEGERHDERKDRDNG
jgi:hypothetical protein